MSKKQPDTNPLQLYSSFKHFQPIDTDLAERLSADAPAFAEFYEEESIHLGEHIMDLQLDSSSGGMGPSLNALYSMFPMATAEQMATFFAKGDTHVQVPAFAGLHHWGMNPFWHHAQRTKMSSHSDYKRVINTVLYHEATHIIDADMLQQIDAFIQLQRIGIPTRNVMCDPITQKIIDFVEPETRPDGTQEDPIQLCTEDAMLQHAVNAVSNTMLDMYCDRSEGLSDRSYHLALIAEHQADCFGSYQSMCQAGGITGGSSPENYPELLNEAALSDSGFRYASGSNMSVLDAMLDSQGIVNDAVTHRFNSLSAPAKATTIVAAVRSIVWLRDVNPASGGGAGDGDGEPVEGQGPQGQGMGSAEPGQQESDGGQGENENESEGGGGQPGQGEQPLSGITPEALEKMKADHQSAMNAVAQQAGSSPLFEAFKLRQLDAAKRDYKSIIRQSLRGSQLGLHQKKSAQRPYPPELHRRIIRPTRKVLPQKPALVFLDTSGSMGFGYSSGGTRGDLERLTPAEQVTREMVSLIQSAPISGMWVVPCDWVVHPPIWLSIDKQSRANASREVAKITADGGGGTSFSPPFEWLQGGSHRAGAGASSREHSPMPQRFPRGAESFACCIYYTDGYGELPGRELCRKVESVYGGARNLFWVMSTGSNSDAHRQVGQNAGYLGRALTVS